MGKWTDDQLQYLREHSRSQSAAAIAAALGRTEGSVRQKRRSLGLQSYHAGWTKAEEQFLQDQWGVMSIPSIAKRLNRSVEAVVVRKNRLGLGPVLFGGDYISMNQLVIAVCGNNAGGGYKLKSWVENRGLPIHTKRVNQNSFRVIRLNEFWKWAEQHRSFIDFSKMEPLALGEEPAWVAEQRKKDFQSFAIQRKDPWTPDEDARLKMLLQQQPVARDLRQISAALKMITDMERIGDQAEDIAEIIGFLNGRSGEECAFVGHMARAAISMVTGSVDAFVRRDVTLAHQVIAKDDVVDEDFRKVKATLIDWIAQRPDDGEYALDLLMIAKYFERIGDHATNIAGWVVFAVTGAHEGEEN